MGRVGGGGRVKEEIGNWKGGETERWYVAVVVVAVVVVVVVVV